MALFVVATPIGNLADASPRLIDVLSTADIVAAEDTRHTGKLLKVLGISARLEALHEHNEARRTPGLVDALKDGKQVALVSDAGTPCVNDPGFHLITSAIDAGIQVVPIPGPSAILAALVASGLPPDRFRFEGFLPRKPGQRAVCIDALDDQEATTLFFESPRRIVASLRALAERLPERRVAVCRELTKLHEEVLRGTACEVADTLSERDSVKGEITLVVAGRDEARSAEGAEIRRYVDVLRDEGLAPAQVRSAVAKLLGVGKKAVFEVMKG